MNSLRIFLPQLPASQIEQSGLLDKIKNDVALAPLKQDWQSLLCEVIGYPFSDLPWSRLRLSLFKFDPKVRTACCCDPVMMQLTHRGAYMIGQNQLQISHNDAIRIVAKINEKLMREGENLYLVDKHAWLFTSEKEISLSSLAPQELIGKDMINFPYAGDDASYWQQLATEIQMLIKQMVDYQGLPKPPAETLINIHFFDSITITKEKVIPLIKNDSITVVSDNELIKSFCVSSFLAHKDCADLRDVRTPDSIVIAFDTEQDKYNEIIQFWVEQVSLKRLGEAQIMCQDATFNLKPKKGFLKRLFRI